MPLRLKPADLIIIISVLAMGLGGLWYNLNLTGAPPPQKYAAVYVDNKLVAELSLADHYLYEFTFNGKDLEKHRAQLEVEPGRIRMLPLDRRLCPRGICSHTGWISKPYESIVCLPNRILVIFPAGPSGDNGVDGFTY